jgi:hypothetical protein
VRFAFVVCLLAAICGAADDEQRVHALVEQLSSPSGARRRTAYDRLARMGEKIVPILQKIDVDDPDVRRLLRQLTRSARKVRLVVVAPPARHRLGAPFELVIEIVNETEDTWLFPLARTMGRFGKTFSAFGLRVGDVDPVHLSPDQVEPAADLPNPPVLRPGHRMRFTIRLPGAAAPLRRPGKIEFTVFYDHRNAQQWRGWPDPPVPEQAEAVRQLLKVPPFTIEASGSTAQELGAALAGGGKARTAALAELELRTDAAVVPVLRRNAKDKDLRLVAVRRLGAAAKDEDFKLVYDATRDSNRAVRRAAVEALGNYPRRKARARLIGLVQDQDYELTPFAVKALRKHKHPVTIDCFIVVMRGGDERLVREIADILWDWTGKPVSNRRSEIERFAAWWLRNRAEWTREHAPRR